MEIEEVEVEEVKEYHLFASYSWIPEEVVVRHPQFTTIPYEIDDDAESVRSSMESMEEIDVSDRSNGKKLIKCDFCPKQFSTKGKLMLHTLSHSKTYNCDICSTNFKNENNLEKHLKSHYIVKELFKCSSCDESYDSISKLKEHCKKHSFQNPWICDKCEARFQNRNELVAHKKTHLSKGPYECEICGKNFSLRHHLKRHSLVHNGEKPFSCHICSKSFADSGHLKCHIVRHNGQKQMKFKCELCKLCFKTRNEIKEHHKSHSVDNPWICNKCDARYPIRDELMQHKKTHIKSVAGNGTQKHTSTNFVTLVHTKELSASHLIEKPWECKNCDLSFPIRSELVLHKKICMKIQNGQENLSDSGNEILKVDKLNNRKGHKKEFNYENPWLCDKCGASFPTRQELMPHKKICSGECISISELEERRKNSLNENPWSCNKCDSRFPFQTELILHKKICMKINNLEKNGHKPIEESSEVDGSIKDSSVKNPWLCEKCNARFPTRQELVPHKKICMKNQNTLHDQSDTSRDSICDSSHKDFINVDDTSYLTKKSLIKNPWICDKCNSRFPVRNDLVLHKKICISVQTDQQNLSEINDVNFDDSNESQDRTKSSEIDNPWICEKCDNSFPTREDLVSHKKIHSISSSNMDKSNLKHHSKSSPNDKIEFNCPTCSKSFEKMDILNDHIKIHSIENPWICENCDSSYPSRDELVLHRKIHKSKTEYKCEICYKLFSHNHHLKRHSFIHTGKKPFNCHVCMKSFADSSDLKRHMKIHPGQLNQFKCEACEKSFEDLSDLKQHKKMHTNKCNICGQQFVHHCHLKRHLITHTGLKPFKCEICDAQFSRNYHLKRHMQTHTGEKPFRCDICMKQFTRDWHLKRHSKIHTIGKISKHEENADNVEINEVFSSSEKKKKKIELREKNHECDVCQKKFTSPGRLKQHEQSHDIETPQKTDSFLRFNDSNSLTEHMIFYTDSESQQWDHSNSEKFVTFYCDMDTQLKPLSDEMTYVSNIDEDIGSNEYLLSSNNQSEDRLSFMPFFSSLAQENDKKVESKFQAGNENDQEILVKDDF